MCASQKATSLSVLRSNAEARLRQKERDLNQMSHQEMKQIIHDLHVHQIELQMQNENLRLAQEEVEAARERYVDLFDFAPVGYLTLSKHGLIIQANLTSVSLLGVERSRLLNEPLVRFVLESDHGSYYRWLPQVFRPGTHQSCELRLQPAKGQFFYARLQAVQASENGAPACRLTISDITEQKRAAELLESRAKHLDALVQERTAQLQEAINELEHFSYTLAHDLRAPLRAISGYSTLLREESASLSPSSINFLEKSAAAAQRMDRLITDALNYNKIVRQRHPLEPVDCGALLQEIVESYPQFQEARASITIEGVLPVVIGNPALLTQCFSNLLSNALKFVAPGTIPHVGILAQELESRVRIVFKDNGIGIPQESLLDIFKMFHRLHPAYEGTGIGLTLVKKAVERMQGSIGVESDENGSRFWLDLKKP